MRHAWRLYSGAAMQIIKFGKFRGKRMGDVPGSYLSWITREMEGSVWAERAQIVMESRDRLGIHGGDTLQRISTPSPPTWGSDRFRRIQRENKYGTILNSCSEAKALSTGKWMHERIVRKGLTDSIYLGNLLVKMYGSCGDVHEARLVFDQLGERRNTFSWILMMAAYAKNGQVHEARLVFEQMPRRDVVSWTAVVGVHVQSGHYREAVDLFKGMLCDGMKPDRFAYASALDACSSLRSLSDGRQLHSCISESGLDGEHRVSNSLIFMYGRCGSPDDAREVVKAIYFGEDRRDRLTLTLLMAAYTENGRYGNALEVFRKIARAPFPVTYILVLEACARVPAYGFGKSVHSNMPEVFQAHGKVGSALINMYSSTGSLEEARGCFDKILKRDTAVWSAIIAAYARNGHTAELLNLFKAMQLDGATPNNFTFSAVISSCSKERMLGDAREQMVAMAEDYKLSPVFKDFTMILVLLACTDELELAEDLLGSMSYEPAWGTVANLKLYIEAPSKMELILGTTVVPRVIEDVYGVLRKKLVPEQVDVETWLDTDLPGRKFTPVLHPLEVASGKRSELEDPPRTNARWKLRKMEKEEEFIRPNLVFYSDQT